MGSSVSTVPSELAASGAMGAIPYAEPAWKQEVNHKIAAARARRLAGQPQADTRAAGEDAGGDEAKSKAARVAAAVAARYAQAPSYSDYLESEVHAARMAAVAAQAAANHARAAADAIYIEMNSAQVEAPQLEVNPKEMNVVAESDLQVPVKSPAPQPSVPAAPPPRRSWRLRFPLRPGCTCFRQPLS